MTGVSGTVPPLVLISFRLGADEYAIELGRVREIVPFVGATWLPGFAVAVRGAVDLRGEAVPAIELATAIGVPAGDPTPESCLLVVEVGRAGEPAAVGLIADAVRGIVELDPEELAAGSRELAGSPVEHVVGVATVGDRFLRVVDLDRLLGSNPRVRGPQAAPGGRAEVDVIAPEWRRELPSAGEEPSRRRRTPTAAFAVERQPHLVVLVAGGPLALPMEAIERIVGPEGLAAFPDATGALRGVMTLPDVVVAVLDPAALFERTVLPLGAERCVVVLRRDADDDGPAAGLLVAGVREVFDLARFEIAAPPRAGGLFAARWIAGMTRVGGLVPILDLPSLLGSPLARAALTAAGEWLPREDGGDGPRSGST